MELGDISLTVEEIEAIINGSTDQTPPAGNDEKKEETLPATQPVEGENKETEQKEKVTPENIETTRAFSKRLSEKTTEAVKSEREKIAKQLGYASYEDMNKKLEAKILQDKGLDPEEVAPVVEKLLEKRLNEDPRMKELEALRAKQIEAFGKQELAEITKLTGGEITSLAQLPKEVLEIWKEKGSLKTAFLTVKGEELILKARGEQSKGSTEHIVSPTGPKPGDNKLRPLTATEKQTWKFFNPGMSDEELDKIRTQG